MSLPKKYVGLVPTLVVAPTKPMEAAIPTPPAIIAERMLDHSEGSHHQVLVEWQGSHDEATWEDWDSLVKLFSANALEDKVVFQWGVML